MIVRRFQDSLEHDPQNDQEQRIRMILRENSAADSQDNC